MNRFIERFILARLDGPYIKLLNQLEKVPLIILDDFGLAPLDHNPKLTLLQLLEDRYGERATIITSQLQVKSWHQYLDEPTLADEIIDRVSGSAHRIDLKGESLSKKI
jgi:DNA replication protein DnaC